MEIGGVEHAAGEVVDFDEANLKAHLRRNAVKLVKKAASKKKKKAEPAAEE
tara:strand:- start:2711 stop:2863 length:153 start_codon:yes stop_codon:yes gene_type:complete